MSEPAEHVFGYGSLVERPGAVRCALSGWERRWGVAMDNAVDLPGYKHYLDPETGERPPVLVAFIDVVPVPGAAVVGVAFAVDRATLRELDARERNYERVEVGGALSERLDGPVWAYVGRADARARRDRGLRDGRLVIDRAYRDGVAAGLAALGAQAPAAPCPVRPLRLVALPGGASA